MINPIHNSLKIVVCKNAEEASARGYNYSADGTEPVRVKEVVVVKKGTERGLPTVDFILETEEGQRFVFMVTGALLKSIPC